MKSNLVFLCLVLVVVLLESGLVQGDIYGHTPRFSNNRLNEEGVNRDNNNRLMDTQNNAKGGYCWGPKMYYYVGSMLPIEWTAQHSCGNPNAECQVVVQYMCGDLVRDGATTQTPPDDKTQVNETVSPDPLTNGPGPVYKYGMHESYQYYQDCKTRSRNKGLYLADQRVGGQAVNTRQNPGGGRSGFECSEERDYYPYWHPSPWKDIAVLVTNTDRCDYYKSESQNVKAKNYCANKPEFNNQADCVKGGGNWTFTGSWNISAPDCLAAQWSRDNHLGNTKDGYPAMYNWTVPNEISENCVVRLRYNISVTDVDNWNINASSNGDTLSPLQNDPSVPVMGRNVTLALNTAQTGRTFQDRTHVFAIRPRPSNISDSARIFNLNVRGKRGNIVQVYPAVEYDFVPQRVNARVGDYVHVQWTGCDTNPQNNDGEGTRGTDRSNIVQLASPDDNYPWVNKPPGETLFSDPTLEYRMAHVNQNDTQCHSLEQLLEENGGNLDRVERSPFNCAKLNAASRYFDGGLVSMEKNGKFFYMSTRNNNFSNRSQKGALVIESILPAWALVFVVIGGLLFMLALMLGVAILYAKVHPQSKVSSYLQKLEKVTPHGPRTAPQTSNDGMSDSLLRSE